MTPTQRAAMQAALEWLEHLEDRPHVRGSEDCHEDMIAELHAALAEPPTDQDIEEHIDGLVECWRLIGAKEAMRGMNMYGPQDAISERGLRKSEIEHRRAIRAALAEPEVEQEPVAVARVDDLERGGRVRALAMNLSLDAPLYTAPPRREWRGLTNDERQRILDTTHPDSRWTLAERVEYRLKERNA